MMALEVGWFGIFRNKGYRGDLIYEFLSNYKFIEI